MTTELPAPTATSPTPPLVSVIIPSYNSGPYLGDAIDSMRAQTLREIEIIVVDDGSTDDSLAVARARAALDSRVRVIARAAPSGRPSIPRNEAMRAARGRYIALLDADDVSTETRLESAIRAMTATGARFAFTDMQRRYEETGALAPEGQLAAASFTTAAAAYLKKVDEVNYLCAPLFPAYLLLYIAVNTSTITFERSLLEKETPWFDESIVRFEDVDLWFRLAERTQFAFVNEVQTLVRKHAQSITATDPVSTRIDGIAVRRKHLARLRPRMSVAEIAAAERNIGELQFHVAYAEWCAGQGASARRWFLHSWRSRPTVAALTGYLKAFVPRNLVVPGAAGNAAGKN
ncbi:MAG TPA: glycosyltransferase family 2 protein [Gemmatimonadaceae bacterium]|nr:glycosyltransferase family 2 protein [Gemmatimonadaceae bacterium]